MKKKTYIELLKKQEDMVSKFIVWLSRKKKSERRLKETMAIKCDTCNTDVTPSEDTLGDEMIQYEVIDLNGKICLCSNCLLTLAHFVRSANFKKYRETNKELLDLDLDEED